MTIPRSIRLAPASALLLALSVGCGPGEAPPATGSGAGALPTTHQDLVAFYGEWREFQRPVFVDGVPDYSAEAMARQHRELAAWQARLAAMDTTGWSVSERVNWHLVKAEMAGLDFDHRVLQPWARMPWFYTMIHAGQSDVPAHEGPFLAGWIDTWAYSYPLSEADAREMAGRVATLPRVLEQARANLTGDARDLWLGGIRAMRRQSGDLDALASRVAGTSAELDGAIAAAREANDAFVTWLEEQAPSRAGPSGVGVEAYDWYVQHVHLVPFTWAELVGFTAGSWPGPLRR